MEVSSVSLRETLGPVSFVNSGDVTASTFHSDSRKISPGDVFVAVPGSSHHGDQFVEAAVAAGASAIIAESPNPRIGVPQCIVSDVRAAYARICMAQYGWPGESLKVVGVTGTNGKTTTTWLLRSILETARKTVGLIGTIEYSNGRTRCAASLTTPAAPDLARLFAQMVEQRATHCVMEISSHALDQRRSAAVSLAAAAITNVTQDHFDYHGDERRYRTAKSMIAELLTPNAPLFLGIDDAGCRQVHELLPAGTATRTFGFDKAADLGVEVLAQSTSGQDLRFRLQSGHVEVRTALVGHHNALNLLTAAALAEQLEIDLSTIADGLENVTHVPGRMERIECGQPFTVLVDFAHTPDGLTHCLATARTLTEGKLIVAFGAGGDRDPHKRPMMAEAASAADMIVVTSDNPRSESPTQIIDQICAGFRPDAHVQVCVDRQKAIQLVIQAAGPGDVVVIAGRGHETVQEMSQRVISFDDRKVAAQMIRERMVSEMKKADRTPDAIPA
jgi:UDP-N-acetylmuramoyl-L-alanyl-D-glutamate--2,6-diaminopimelate ligase